MVNSIPPSAGSSQTVAPVDAHGVALWADDVHLIERLAAVANCKVHEALVIDGDSWRLRFQQFADSLALIDRAKVRAVAIDKGGRFNPWKSCGLDPFRLKLSTEWFPKLLNEGGLVPHFQPIVRVSTGEVMGFESLIRGTVAGELKSGGEIIDAARVHNALFQLDESARVAAIRHCAPQLRTGEQLFVNFLPLTVRDPETDFLAVWEALEAAHAPPSCLVFEVVESEAFPDLSQLKLMLEHFRSRGSKVALDDLGTGNAALVYVDELQPDAIKLAKGLIPEQPRQDDLMLVRGLVDHAHLRGIKVIAEGIETVRQWQAAAALDIDYVQGWLVARPEAQPRRELNIERLLAA